MALERGDVWWLPALYLQKSELEPASGRRDQQALRWRAASTSARAQSSSGALEQRILANAFANAFGTLGLIGFFLRRKSYEHHTVVSPSNSRPSPSA